MATPPGGATMRGYSGMKVTPAFSTWSTMPRQFTPTSGRPAARQASRSASSSAMRSGRPVSP